MSGFSIRSSKISRRRRAQALVLVTPATVANKVEAMQDWTVTTVVDDVTAVKTVLVEVDCDSKEVRDHNRLGKRKLLGKAAADWLSLLEIRPSASDSSYPFKSFFSFKEIQ